MVARQKIVFLLKTEQPIENILIKGWVRTKRDSKTFSFIELNDGSCLKNMQIVADANLSDYTEIKKLTTGSAVAVWGNLVASRGGGQKWEVQATRIDTISLAPESYPLQKKTPWRRIPPYHRSSETPYQQIRRRIQNTIRNFLESSPVFQKAWFSLHPHACHYRIRL